MATLDPSFLYEAYLGILVTEGGRFWYLFPVLYPQYSISSVLCNNSM